MKKGLHERYDYFIRALRERKRLLIAFSGGCDSSFLLAAAQKTLGRENVLAVTAVSASLSEKEKNATQDFARRLEARHVMIETDELTNPSYTANPSNRCFFCKDELFEKLSPLAEKNRMRVADGFNASDRSDYRPGFKASEKWHVVHPLDQAELTKRDIRVLSRWMGLPTWNKPASPCLSSRIPYGTAVTEKILKQIEKAEEVVRLEGFSVVRVRHFGFQARIEVPLREISRLKERERWERIVKGILACGYRDVIADERGFQSGRLNQHLLVAPFS